jgi:tRNA threonylcarbamoyladenosine biosynthesis protein TsaB
MIILALDTSSRTGSLALLRDRDVVAGPVLLPEGPHSVHLLGGADVLCASAGASCAGIDLFAVCNGPGSFTGLRVGITTAMAWGEAYAKPLAAISSLEAIAANAPSDSDDLIAAVVDAHRGQVFGALYERESGNPFCLRKLTATVIGDPAEVLAGFEGDIGGRMPVFSTPTPEIFSLAMSNSLFAGARVAVASWVLSPAIGRLGYERAIRGQTVTALDLEANYVRRPDAEMNWRAS